MSEPVRIWKMHVADGGRARVARIDHDHLGVAVTLGLNRPLETARMVFGGIATLTNIMSVFLMSTQPLVIAPRPKVGPRPETVGPCQTLA